MTATEKLTNPEEVLQKVFFTTLDRLDKLEPEKQDRDAVNNFLLDFVLKGTAYYSSIDKDALPDGLKINDFIARFMSVSNKYTI